MLDEAHQVVELDQRRPRAAAAAPAGTRPAARRAAVSARAPSSARGRSSTVASRHERPGGEVARVERLQRVADHAPDRGAGRRVAADRAVDDVEQLADRHRGRARRVRALVVAGVGDDQPLGRGQQRVEQQLAVLAARVAVADVRVVEHQVVAVARRLARERAVVEAEQADDPVRDRAHRHERADRQVAGAEVRPRRPALEAVGEQRADVGQRERVGADAPSAVASATTSSRIRCELAALPGVALARRGERVGGAADRGGPLRDRLRRAERVDRASEPRSTNSAKRPASSIAPLSTSSSGSTPPKSALALLGHRHAEQDPVEPGSPGAGGDAVELERRAVRGVEAPADAAGADPVLDPREVVVVEAEPAAHRLAVGQVEHLRGGDALRRRARAAARPRRAPGWSGAASGRRGGRAGRRSATSAASSRRRLVVLERSPGAERGLDQRREGLDVRAHHDHVARLERRVLGEQVQDRVADDLDLAGAAVAGVDLEAAVVAGRAAGAGRRSPGQRRPGRLPVRADVGLDAARAACRRPADAAVVMVDAAPAAASDELQLARVAAPRGEQAVRGQRRRSGRRDGARLRPGVACTLARSAPQRGRRMQQEQVDVARARRARAGPSGGRRAAA